MGRLSKHEKKQALFRTFFFFVLIIVFLYSLATYGLKILINGSLFINELANNSKNLPKSKDRLPLVLTNLIIDPPPSATNSSHLIVSGSVVNIDFVEVYVNHEKITEIPVENDFFSEEISGLEKGENNIYFIGKSLKTKDTKKSATYTVLYKYEKPKLEITEPSNNSKTDKSEIKIRGKTDKETYIKVNNQPVVISIEGNFETSLILHEGENTITVVAEDIVGNTETKEVKIIYSKDN